MENNNITNNFGGTLYEYIGKETAIDLMNYVDEIKCENSVVRVQKMYSTSGTHIKKLCMQNKLNLFGCICSSSWNRYQLCCS